MTSTPSTEFHSSSQSVSGAQPTGLAYHQGLRGLPKTRIWKCIVAIVVMALCFAVITLALQVGGYAISQAVGFSGFVTPITFAALNLSWGVSIPLAIVVQRAFFGAEAPSLSSVVGRLRWRLIAGSAAVLIPAWAAFTYLSTLVQPLGPRSGAFDATSIAFLVVCLLTTPLQAAGEEYIFRGFANRSIGSCFGHARLALVVASALASVLFMFAHGSTDMWLNAHYLVFGLGLSLITWRTGGLEIPVVVHAVNNVASFVAAFASGMDPNQMFNRQAGAGGPFMLMPIAFTVLVTAGVFIWAAKARPATTIQSPNLAR